VETLEDGAIEDKVGRPALLNSMSRETSRLIQIVNQLLLLTRSDAGALSLNCKPFDLEQLVKERSELQESLANQKGVIFRITPAGGGSCQVNGDRSRIAQVLDNLLDNALRYAPEESTIHITVENLGPLIQTRIEDSGPGIPGEDLPHIFDRFYRVEKSRDRDSGGAGLGLAIAKSLVEAHGGQIEVHSERGQGTKVTFLLPAVNLSDN
jgi:signal transduction histidine kinase